MAKLDRITGTLILADGTESQFQITADTGWQQWGADTQRLGETGWMLDSIERVLNDDGAFDGEPEDDDPEDD